MGGYERLSISEGSSSSSLVDEEDWTPPSRSERTGLVQQRNFLAILAIVLALALGVQSVRHHAPPPLPASRPPAASPTPSTPRVSSQQDAAVGASRPYAGLARGHWSPPSRAWTKQDVLHQWGAPAQGNVGSANKARLEQLSAWEWKPEMAIREWESFEFIKRCMNSEKGLLLVGDSVTMQSVEALKGMLNLPSGNYKGNSNGWFQKATGSPLHQALFASNSTIALLAEALPHVPAERLRQPFAHLLRHDTLLDQAEMRPIAESLGLGGTFKFEGWLANSSWEEVLPKQAEKRWEGEQNSVLFFNTGAHWSLICLGLEKAGLGELARAVARTLLPRLLSTPSLDIIYRSTSPAHPSCSEALTPVYPALPFADTKQHPDWSWGSFGELNDVWAEQVDLAAPEGRSTESGGKVAFLNVTDMTGQRPDAHMGNGDCLHWALPVIPGTWIKMLWTIMMDD